MPELIAMYIRHCLIGFAAAIAFVALLFWFNIGNLWHLVTHSDVGLMATIVLVILNGIVFSGVQFGIAIMSMARDEEEDDDDDGPGGGRAPDAIPAPVRHAHPRR